MDEIKKIIEGCKWKQEMCGVSICRGSVLPCSKVIEKGECDVLKEYFKNKEEKKND